MSDEKRAEEGQANEGAAWAAAQIALGQGGARADAFLDEQARLARVQREQIEEENATRRHLLKIEHVSALASAENWEVKELYAEPGRLDEVFRAITTHDAKRAREIRA